MDGLARRRALRGLLICLVAICLTGTGLAQPPETLPEGLVGEIAALRPLFLLGQPVLLRFTLHNLSDEPAEIPLLHPADADGGIHLPLELVFGTEEAPALTVFYDDEKGIAVPPPYGTPEETPRGPDEPPPPPSVLKLAPRASLGIEIDLRAQFNAARYAGAYRIEWRPLGARLPIGSVAFRIEQRQDAVFITDKAGKITFELYYDRAPRNVQNFLELVRQGFYDGKTFHKVIPGFVLYGGCPKGDGTGLRPDGKLVPAEFHNTPFELGTLAMARRPTEPDSASCQFFITLARLPELDGQFTIIGQARDAESLRTLQELAAEPTDDKGRPRRPLTIRSIRLVESEEGVVSRLDLKPTRSSQRRSVAELRPKRSPPPP